MKYSDTEVVLACLLTPLSVPMLILASRAYLHFAPSTGYTMRSRLVAVRDYLNFRFYNQIEVPWQLFQVAISFVSAGLYVVDTYRDRTRPWSTLHSFDLVLTLFFLVDYLWAFVMASNKVSYFFSFFSIVDVYSIVPFFVLAAMTDLNSTSLVFRAMNGFRILRVLRTHRILEFTKSELQRQLIIVVLTIIGFLFCFTCLIQLIEDSEDSPLNMWDALWFVAVSSTTVGYGDIVPNTLLGRIFVMIIIFIGIVLIPLQTGKLISIIQALPKYAGSFKKSLYDPHVVIVVGCNATMDAAVTFLREFFHRDNDLQDHRVVVLSSSSAPSPSLAELLAIPFFDTRVTYLSGSPLDVSALHRAKATDATAIFLPVDQLAREGTQEDSSAILKAIALSEYVPHVRVYTQTLHRRNIGHMAAAGADVVLCVDEIKMGIFALSCISPGTCTLLTNLVRSYSDVDGTTGWTHEYAYGFSQEVYVEVVAKPLAGKTFAQAALTIYQSLDAMAFGVFILSRGKHQVWINPGNDYVLVEGDRVFIIAQSKRALLCPLFVSPEKLAAEAAAMAKAQAQAQAQAQAEMEAAATAAAVSTAIHAGSNPSSASSSSSSPPSPSPFSPGLAAARRGSTVYETTVPTRSTEGHGDNVEFARHNIVSDSIPDIEIIPEWALNSEYLTDPYSLEESLVVNPKNNIWQNVYNFLPPSEARTEAEILNKPPPGTPHTVFTNHIVVCGSHSGLASLIIPLRSSRLERHPTIVLLSPTKPGKELWFVLTRFPDVYWVKGSAAVFTDLYKVNVGEADRILVLANSENPSDDQLMLDADTIFSLRSIRHKFETGMAQIQYIAELAHGSNTKFLMPSASDVAPTASDDEGGIDMDASTVRRLTEVGATPLFDTDDPAFAASVADYTFLPQFVSGSVFTSPIIDSLLCQSYIKPFIIDIIRQMLGLGNDACHTAISSQISQIDVPPLFVHKTYGELVEHLTIDMAIIPLGLYRLEEALGHRYVFTNPDSSSRILHADRVFILSRGPEHHGGVTSLSPDDDAPEDPVSMFNEGMVLLNPLAPGGRLSELRLDSTMEDGMVSMTVFDEVVPREFIGASDIQNFVSSPQGRDRRNSLSSGSGASGARFRSRASTAPTRFRMRPFRSSPLASPGNTLLSGAGVSPVPHRPHSSLYSQESMSSSSPSSSSSSSSSSSAPSASTTITDSDNTNSVDTDAGMYSADYFSSTEVEMVISSSVDQ